MAVELIDVSPIREAQNLIKFLTADFGHFAHGQGIELYYRLARLEQDILQRHEEMLKLKNDFDELEESCGKYSYVLDHYK